MWVKALASLAGLPPQGPGSHETWKALVSACSKRLLMLLGPCVQVVGDLIRKSPHIAIIPALVLALLLGLGIWGVFAGIHARRDQARCAQGQGCTGSKQCAQVRSQARP